MAPATLKLLLGYVDDVDDAGSIEVDVSGGTFRGCRVLFRKMEGVLVGWGRLLSVIAVFRTGGIAVDMGCCAMF